MANLSILIKEPYKTIRPKFVPMELFGVTDVDIHIRKISVTGMYSTQNNISILF